MRREQGHHLLKRLGKTKLRPGGITATNWLLDKISFHKDLKILEVACNEAANLIRFAKEHGTMNYGIDLNEEWLKNGVKRVQEENLEDRVILQVGNATALPFEDNSFDVILNEAMLTMLNQSDKEAAVREYYRVLKPGGLLLTHDVRQVKEDMEQLNQSDKEAAVREYYRVLKPGGLLLTHDVRQVKEDMEQVKKLQQVLNVQALPLTLSGWVELLGNAGFKNVEYKSDEMTLLSEEGLAIDEGIEGKQKILENAMKDENKEQFFEMMDFFAKTIDNLYYIAVKAQK